MTSRLSMFMVIALAPLAATVSSCQDNGDNSGTDSDTWGEGACPWDDDDTKDKAGELALNQELEGYLCPTADQDWYSFTVPSGSDLLSVSLILDAPVSPLDLTYAVWPTSGSTPLTGALASEAATAGKPLMITHGLAAGDYLLQIKDRADDSMDTHHAYKLALSTAKDADTAEPNNDAATASTSTSSAAYISYRGDEDWYRVDLPIRGLVTVELTMEPGGIEPAFDIVDSAGELLATGANAAGQREATALYHVASVGQSGAFYVIVRDDNGLDFDATTPYSLTLTIGQDPDQNEPNNVAAQATSLGSATCGGSFGAPLTQQGYLGSTGDADWYKVELSGCANGVVAAELAFSGAGVPDDLQAALRFFRPVTEVSCTQDQDCAALPNTCDKNIDCATLGNTCLAQGVCAGGGFCLPQGVCGALLVANSAREKIKNPSNIQEEIINPNRHKVSLAAPAFGLSQLYISVEDFQGDTFSLTNPYTLTVRAGTDPDIRETFSTYTAGREGNEERSLLLATASPIVIHDCSNGDCCGAGTWIEGSVSFTFDSDWYWFANPCPDLNCMLRFHYDLDTGPVDHLFELYHSKELYFDSMSGTPDNLQSSQPAKAGSYGGVGASEECLYVSLKHGGADTRFTVAVADTIWVAKGRENDGVYDYSLDQKYRFCVEKLQDGCVEPCEIYQEGCFAPK